MEELKEKILAAGAPAEPGKVVGEPEDAVE